MADERSSGGLVPPPGPSESPTKPMTAEPPYFKRPETPNRDNCDACKKSGRLIICDRCSASFHFGCTDPPIDENDIPTGIWLCKKCKTPATVTSGGKKAPVNNEGAPVPTSSKKRTRNQNSAAGKKKAKAKKAKTRKEEIRMEMSMMEENQRKEEERIKARMAEVEMKVKEAMSNIKKMSPMEMLVQAAQIMDPKFFAEKRDDDMAAAAPKKDLGNQPHQSTADPWRGNVPLPARQCSVCGRNSRLAPLMQCDYCPLLFHQDCLDPPMNSLPTGRWMCPNHEQPIDMRVVNSVAATDRVALWDQFSMPAVHPAVRTDFVRNPRRNRSRFRVKVLAPPRGRVVVPNMVSKNYHHLAPLLPLRREFVRCRNVPRNPMNMNESNDASVPRIPLKLSCPTMYTKKPSKPRPPETITSPQPSTSTGASTSTYKTKPPEHTIVSSEVRSSSEDSDSDFDRRMHATVMRRKAFHERSVPVASTPKMPSPEDNDFHTLYTEAKEGLKTTKTNRKMIKVLAWQMVCQIAAGKQMELMQRKDGGLGKVVAQVYSALQQHAEAVRPSPAQLFVREDREHIASVWEERPAPPPPPRPRMFAPPPPPTPPPPPPRRQPRDARIVATIVRIGPLVGCAVSLLGQPLQMRSDSISLGTSVSCDLVFEGGCQRVSDMHAIIFRDKATGYFELLNYSEWGTLVNGVRYGIDIKARQTNGSPERSVDMESEMVAAQLRSLIDRNLPQNIRVNEPLTSGAERCACSRHLLDNAYTWEGSVVVNHGALLQFGCYKFVFSITGAVAFPYIRKNKNPAI